MVVVVEFVVDFKICNVVCAVVLVDGVHDPSFDTVYKSVGTYIVFAFEVAVLEEVLNDFTVFNSPFGLVSVVRSTESSHLYAVAVSENSLVGCYGETVCVEFAVLVVEFLFTAVGSCRGVGDADLRCTVVESHFFSFYESFECGSFGCNGVGVECRHRVGDFYAAFHRVAVFAGSEAVGEGVAELVFSASGVDCAGFEVFGFKFVAITGKIDVGAEVAATQDYLTESFRQGAQQCDADFTVLFGIEDFRIYREACSCRYFDLVGRDEVCNVDFDSFAVAGTFDSHCVPVGGNNGGYGSISACCIVGEVLYLCTALVETYLLVEDARCSCEGHFVEVCRLRA